jgi:phospholipase D1/2
VLRLAGVILQEGRNCWRIARARRVAFLVDGAAYFSALREAIGRAERQIFILGWDVDSRVRLTPGSDDGPADLLGYLNDVLARRPELRIFVLGWDFSVIFALERELLPVYQFGWRGHPRLRFQLDGVHAVGASHHQKIVVIDDRIAFSGGLDLAIRRWDTPAHRAANRHRIDPAGRPYPPMHDVQVAVDGDAAGALGEIARQRWHAATGERIAAPSLVGFAAAPNAQFDPWPLRLEPDALDAPIGISRTSAGSGATPEVHEVLCLTLDAIAAAKRHIYIENQYLTSATVGQALAARLQEPDGPEIAIVLPREECGWLEKNSMGIMRARLLRRLREADRHGRLGLYYPSIPGLEGGCLNVHSKVLVVDDQLLRVGSSNLSNRSMGLDTECDLAIDAGGDPARAAIVAGLRNRLLAEHLGTSPEALAAAVAQRGSLLQAIAASAAAGARTLQPLPIDDVEPPGGAAKLTVNLAFLDGLVCDPEQPAPDRLLAELVPSEYRRPMHRSLLRYAVLLLALFGIAAAWRFTPVRQLLDVERVVALGRTLRGNPAAPLLALAAYVAGALVLFPITLLLTATALVFDPLAAFIYCLVGALAGALLTYGIGRLLGRWNVRWLSSPRLARIREQLQRRGLIAIVTARILPVGNFSIINMVAGALSIRLRDFVLGNVIGLLPGIIALTLFAHRLGSTLRNPKPRNLVALAAIVVAIVAVVGALRRWLRHRSTATATAAPAGRRD